MFFHSQIRSGARQLVLNSTPQQNLKTLAGNPAGPVDIDVIISAGVVIGSTTAGVPALDIGQFPKGSVINIDIFGSLQGKGGLGGGYYSAGQAGGDCIKADYPDQFVRINLHPTGSMRAGGGGGGSGGWSGSGGTGGQGIYESIAWRDGYNGYTDYDHWVVESFGVYEIKWGNVSQVGGGTPTTNTSHGPWRRGGFRARAADKTSWTDYYDVGYASNVISGGGAGGAARVGGAGGNGQGYNQASAAGAAGQAAVGGAGGGINAGAGGASGTGGAGGAGSGWGVAGAIGGSGGGGQYGASGNYTGGSAGGAGGVGAAGGAAGRYLVKGSASVTFNNLGGTVAGGLA
jgi:hypothetical protein